MSAPSTFVAHPIRTQVPPDFGGINARKGFAYQDHVAAQLCLEMVNNGSVTEVWCETYDDIVLVHRDTSNLELIEFVQVKNERLKQLYSVAKLTAREGKPGTSVLERSLKRDNCSEPVQFRIVTSCDINAELSALKMSREKGLRQLEPQATAIKELKASLASKPAGAAQSLNSNSCDFWVDNTLWEVLPQEGLVCANKLNLLQFLEGLGIPVYSDTLNELYERLLWRVKSAAEADFVSARETKILKKDELITWMREQASPLPTKGTDAKLEEKLRDAGQPNDTIESAIEMRHQYNRELRSPTYLTLDSIQHATDKVRGVLHHLKTQMDGGEVSEGQPFHSLCVGHIIAVKDDCDVSKAKPSEGLLVGCMYEITSRCRHRFVRPKK